MNGLIIEVVNLSTLEKRVYTMTPKEAVKAAYLQSNHDYNTWDYSKHNLHVIEGKYTVACGDWVALKRNKSY
ncbi:MAG: hypothetical protein PWQ37_2855 [Candidatus Petromonas sp.]|jgi:aminopeptidase-like protein|nr:hypothetical protein [Candidatus Petromonas sp.]